MTDNQKIIRALIVEIGGITIGTATAIIATITAFYFAGGWGVFGVFLILAFGSHLGGIEASYKQWKFNRRNNR